MSTLIFGQRRPQQTVAALSGWERGVQGSVKREEGEPLQQEKQEQRPRLMAAN